MKKRGFNIYHCIASDCDGTDVILHVASNIMSSSILDPKEHLEKNPHVKFPSTMKLRTKMTNLFYF